MNRLKRNLRKNMNIIKKQYKAALSASKLNEQTLTDSEKAANIWLTDNFRLLEKISSRLIGYIKSGSIIESSSEVEKAYRVCFEMCENGILPSTSELISYLLSRKISLSALLQLEFFTAAALIAHVAEGAASNPSQCINAIKSLNRLPDTDFKKILNEVSGTEKILCQDPTGEYRMMTEETKNTYRLAVCRTSQKEGVTEIEAAVNALEKAKAERRHIGFFLELEQDKSKQGRLILTLENLLPLAAAFAFSRRSLPRFTDTVSRRRYLAFSSLSLYLPLREIMKHAGNAAASKISRPTPLPKMDYGKGIPDSAKTVIAVVSILPNAEKAQAMGRHLKELMMSNCRDSTVICLLADLKAAPTPETKCDSEDLEAMTEVINSLNEICPDKVVLAVRPRKYSPREDEWVGRDRKKGAVTALIKLITDGDNQFEIIGNAQILRGAKYLMVLDSDTEMPFGNLKLLVGAASHPLNRPQFKYSENKAEIVSGYGIITPKIEALPGKTKFSCVMAQGGLSYYNTVSGEKYQNLFGKSIFTGKGLINIEAYHRLLTESALLPDAVLSHDIIEGIIMRTGFSGDISLTESFPANEISYYNRLHRWVRGDIQNIPFLFKGLDLLGKYWITDNVARILTPISSALLLIGSAVKPRFGEKSYYAAGIVLLSQILPDGLKLISSGNLNEGKRAFYNLVMLFHTAYINADGAVRAVYRMIRRKNLLQWTTAEQSEAKGTNTVKNHFISSLPSEIAGLALLISGFGATQISNGMLKAGTKQLLLSASGAAAALDFPLSLTSSKEAETKSHISENDAEKLKAYCFDMWRFYTEYSAQRDNYLIPDNVQELPVHRTAHRTSPTNIGLMLCVFLAARDFGFITSEELYSRLDKSLSAVESLPKFKGNLYNWYDTESLSVLSPEYVSTVDSGNFLCCLTALKEGLKEYLSECGSLENIIARCEKLTAECDLGFLYDRQRNLFYIGYDKASASFSQSHYDLLMSEARMTSYFAAAAEIVPVKHWQALSRTLSKDGKYMGPISWTGTMFEYFMPSIFLPAYEGTVEYDGLKLCINAQKKSVKRLNIPYGISESGFYAFDDELNYQYKAHGVPSIALKHIPQKETVISPYSTFLTLPSDPKEAMENLARLEDMGLYGKFGFYEAADFTDERKDGKDFSVVKSFMSHHIGMSFLAAANCIFDGIMQKRFISDSKMLGGKSMLQEKIPRNMKIIEPEREDNSPAKPRRAAKSKTEISDISIDEPNCKILSNGELSLLLSDSGASVLLYKESSVFALRRNPTVYPSGIFAAVKMSSGKIVPFTAAPLWREEKQYTAKFTDCSVVYKNRDSSISCTETAAVHRTLPCEIRIFKIRNRTKSKKTMSLMIYAEPLFSDINFADTHPAFSRLFVAAKYSDKDKALIFTKNEKDRNRQVFLAMGFSDKSDFSYCLDREAVLPSNSGIYGLFTKNYENNSQSADKCAAMEIKFTIQPKAAVSAALLTCVGSNEKEALSALKSARSKRTDALTEYAGCPFSSGSITEIYAEKLIERMFFGRQLPPSAKKAAQKNKSDFSVLWQSGISGDYPIITASIPETEGASDMSAVIPLVKLHSGLRLMGIRTELVFLYPHEDDYFNLLKAEIKRALSKGEAFGIGKKGGIFIINPKNKSEQFINLLKAVSYEIYPQETQNKPKNRSHTKLLTENNPEQSNKNYFDKNGFTINSLPYLPYCHIICNRAFGCLVSSNSLGYTWAINSRENKLTPWINDTRADAYGEKLILTTENGQFDLLKCCTVFYGEDKAEFFASADGIKARVTVSVPPKALCKNIDVVLCGKLQGERNVKISYRLLPVLGDFERTSSLVKTRKTSCGVSAENPANIPFKGGLVAGSKGKFQSEYDGQFITVSENFKLYSDTEKKASFYLAYSANPKTAEKMPYIVSEAPPKNKIEIFTGDKELDNLFNDFLLTQIIHGRIFARTGFYQCSGAYGFRDQIQDAMAVVLTHPKLLRTQIFRCCAAQFSEGDVLHWFHPLIIAGKPVLRGVRTLYSDDLLWLPLAVGEYCLKTGDYSVLSVKISYISAPVLEKGETERYSEYESSNEKGAVYEHCLRAIFHSCQFGTHGLPLIKGGDWNDSFNQVGIKMKGESVWLAMFQVHVMRIFSEISAFMKDFSSQRRLISLTDKITEAIENSAWNGDRYLRCFYDDGAPMGSRENEECAIDILPQAWSVFAKMPNPSRCKKAIHTAYDKLVNKENGFIKLFDPPFGVNGKKAGYVNLYPAGIRENGGQYTHGAVWLAKAFFEANDPDTGYELLSILNPSKKDPSVYKAEPYYLAGDVYTEGAMKGRGGWSIYTGSAGWFYRTVYEDMLGIKQKNNKIEICPCLPKDLKECKVKITINSKSEVFDIRSDKN